MSDIDHTRFYLCDNGDGEDAFIVCGRCIIENDRDPSLYDELPGLPDSVDRTRECISCERDGHQFQSVGTATDQERK